MELKELFSDVFDMTAVLIVLPLQRHQSNYNATTCKKSLHNVSVSIFTILQRHTFTASQRPITAVQRHHVQLYSLTTSPRVTTPPNEPPCALSKSQFHFTVARPAKTPFNVNVYNVTTCNDTSTSPITYQYNVQ